MEQVKKNLEHLGFSTNESRVFVVLMQGKTMTAGEIAEQAAVSRPSAYDILKSFTEKGYINEIETPSKLWYEIIDPAIVQDKIRREINRSHLERLDNLDSSIGRLAQNYKANGSEKKQLEIELIRGFNKHRSAKFISLIKQAKRQILLMNKLEGNISTEQNDETKSFLERGGEFKALYGLNSKVKIKINDKWEQLDKEGYIKVCEEFEKNGIKTRLSEAVPQNMMVVDREVVFLNIINEEGSKSDIIIRNKEYAEFMVKSFENEWNQGITLTQAHESK